MKNTTKREVFMYTVCPQCKECYEVEEKYRNKKVYCPKCEKDFKAVEKLIQCQTCGSKISKSAKYCVHCGDIASKNNFVDGVILYILLLCLAGSIAVSFIIPPLGVVLIPLFLVFVIMFLK